MKTYNFRISELLSIAVFCIIILNVGTLYSQVINEEVTVTAAYEPSVPDANKINIEPPDNETGVKLPVMTYNNSPNQINVKLQPENIAAVKLVGEPQKKLYRNYAKIGLGTYTTPLVDLYAGSVRSKSYNLGLHLKHISSSGEIEGYPIADNSLNQVELYGEKFLEQHTIAADLGFRRNVVHHYGFPMQNFDSLNDPIQYIHSDDDLKQRFARITAGVGIYSNYREDDNLNHFANLSFTNINDLFETRETTVKISAGADKRFELLNFTDYQQLGLTADVELTGLKDSIDNYNSTLVSIKPFISTSFNEYSLKAGLNLNFQLDSISKAYLFPFIEGQLRIIDDALVVHAGITGGLKRQNFNDLSNINPFVQSVLPLKYTKDKFTFYAGLRARAGSNIDFTALVRSSFVENAYFFINDFSMVPYNRFTLIHDDGKILEGRIEAEFHSAEHIKIKAHIGLQSWGLDTLEHAYHEPAIIIGGDAMYQIQNKIIFRAGVVAHGPQYARVLNDQGTVVSETVKGFADISLGIEYRYTKVLSGFLNFNNITNSRYYLWNGYPSYKFNLMGGVAYSF